MLRFDCIESSAVMFLGEHMHMVLKDRKVFNDTRLNKLREGYVIQ